MQKKVKKANKKLKDLPAKAKGVRGGAFDTFAKLGDISGESIDDNRIDFVEMMRRK